MRRALGSAGRLAAKGAEMAAAAMLAAIFLTFLAQIVSRYLLSNPIGWTLELCLVLWVWLVFFGCAFVVRDRDHVRFDILYVAAPVGARRVMGLVGSAAVAVGLLASLPASWHWIDFLRIKRSPTLGVTMREVYAIYAVFLVAVAARAAWRCVEILRRADPDDAA